MPHFHTGPFMWPDNRQGQKRGTASWKWYFSLVTRSLKNKAVQLNRLALIQMTSFRRDTNRSHSPQSINAELLQVTTYINLPLNTCDIFAAKSPYAGLQRSCSLLLVISSSSESSRWGIYLCKSTNKVKHMKALQRLQSLIDLKFKFPVQWYVILSLTTYKRDPFMLMSKKCRIF